jgi:hypothetical protein
MSDVIDVVLSSINSSNRSEWTFKGLARANGPVVRANRPHKPGHLRR